MGSIPPEKNGPEARLPRIETADLDYTLGLDAALKRAVNHYQMVRARWEAQAACGEEMDPAFQALDRERQQAIQAVMEINVVDPEGVQTKLEVLRSALAWCGPDERWVPFAMSLAEEAVACLFQGGSHNKSGGSAGVWGNSGRWLMGAASSVPALILDRFGLG